MPFVRSRGRDDKICPHIIKNQFLCQTFLIFMFISELNLQASKLKPLIDFKPCENIFFLLGEETE